MSAHDPRIHFSWAEENPWNLFVITWPSGIVDKLVNVPINQTITVKEGVGIIAQELSKNQLEVTQQNPAPLSMVQMRRVLMDRVTGLGGLFSEQRIRPAPTVPAGAGGPNHIRDRQDKVRFLVAGWDAGVSVFDVDIPCPKAHT